MYIPSTFIFETIKSKRPSLNNLITLLKRAPDEVTIIVTKLVQKTSTRTNEIISNLGQDYLGINATSDTSFHY